MSFSLDGLPAKDRQEILDIQSGLILPPLHSDVIAKHIFNADVHPDRLNFLMRAISKDNTIEVRSSAGNESFRQSYYRKPRKTPPKRFRPSHTGRMDSLWSLGGDISGPLSFSVLRIFLALYILLQCFQCDATYRGRIVTRTPKRVSGKLFLYLGQVIPTRNSGRNAL